MQEGVQLVQAVRRSTAAVSTCLQAPTASIFQRPHQSLGILCRCASLGAGPSAPRQLLSASSTPQTIAL